MVVNLMIGGGSGKSTELFGWGSVEHRVWVRTPPLPFIWEIERFCAVWAHKN